MVEAIRVLVVADNLLVRAGLAALLDQQEACAVVGQVAADSRLAQAVDLYRPDMLLVDLGWQVSDALDALSILSGQSIPILALISDDGDAAAVFATLAAFTLYGLLLNENDADILWMALQAVYNGLIVIDPALTEVLSLASTPSEPIIEQMTSRENQVLQLLAQGLTNKAIAHQLGITDHTVKFHVNAIMTKLGAQSRTEAVVRATRAGLIIL